MNHEGCELGISGEIRKKDSQGIEYCLYHPSNRLGNCGFTMGEPTCRERMEAHEEASKKTPTISQEQLAAVGFWAISYLRNHHHIVAIADQDWKSFKRWDTRGIVELPQSSFSNT